MDSGNQTANITGGQGAVFGPSTLLAHNIELMRTHLACDQALLRAKKEFLAHLQEEHKRKKEQGLPTEEYVKELEKAIEESDKELQHQMERLEGAATAERMLFASVVKLRTENERLMTEGAELLAGKDRIINEGFNENQELRVENSQLVAENEMLENLVAYLLSED